MKRTNSLSIAATASLCATAIGGTSLTARAQEASGTANAVLEEVVITAERRTENLQRVPIAVQAFTGDDLARRGVTELSSLQYVAPATTIQTNGLNKFINVRGVGLNASTPGVVSGVAQHIDGAFIPGSGIGLGDPWFDLERVEVLRGPQGTFVGQQSTGGAVFIVTRRPRLDGFDFGVEQTVGNYDWRRTSGAINLPISKRVAARAAFNLEQRDSFFHNLGSTSTTQGATDNASLVGQLHPGNVDQQAVRLRLLAEPTDNLEVLLSYEAYRSNNDGWAWHSVNYNGDPYTLAYDIPTLFKTDIDRGIAEINWDLTDSVRLRSLTSYADLTFTWTVDLDATATRSQWQNQQIGPNQFFTQELNLLSNDDSRLQWAVGAFYSYQRQKQSVAINTAQTPNGPQTINVENPKGTTDSKAAFGQVTYDLTPSLQVIAGARHNIDSAAALRQVTTTTRPNALPPVPRILVVPSRGDTETSSTTGKLALNWNATESNLLYVSASKGAKAGGFNAATPTFAGSDFEPEKVSNYEVGWKSTMFNRRLRIGLDVFNMDYQDFQLASFDPQTRVSLIDNLPESEVSGVELQLDAQLGGFGINLAAAYLKSEAKETPLLVDARDLPGGGNAVLPPGFSFAPFLRNVQGRELPYTPEWTVNAGIEYAFQIGGGTLTPRIQYSYIGEQWVTLFQKPVDLLPSRELVDFRMTYRPDDRWTVEGFVTNLDEELYLSGITGTNKFYGTPRQYGVRVAYQYK